MPICLRADLSPRSTQFLKKKSEKKGTGLRRKTFALEIRLKKPKGCKKNKLDI